MDPNSSPYQMVMTTIGNQQQAQTLAENLVNAALAACVNILPKMQSIYRWQGKLEHGDEHLLIIKTRAERVDDVINTIKANHPYELPEIIAVPIAGGFEPYLTWITQSVSLDEK